MKKENSLNEMQQKSSTNMKLIHLSCLKVYFKYTQWLRVSFHRLRIPIFQMTSLYFFSNKTYEM